MVLWSLLSVLFIGFVLFLIGLFLLILYLAVFVLLPGYVVFAIVKLIMWIIERHNGNVEKLQKAQSKLNLPFLEQKYKQMVNEEISIEEFNKYVKNEIHIHYNDNYEYCKHIFEAKMDMVDKNETQKNSNWLPYVIIAALAVLLSFNWFGPKITLLFAAIGVFLFYLLYAMSTKNREDNSAIRYSMYKHIVKFCGEKLAPLTVEPNEQIDVEAAIADAVEQVTADVVDQQTQADAAADDGPVQLEMEIIELAPEVETEMEQ